VQELINTDAPTAAGSGVADEYSPKATYSIKDLLKTANQQDDASSSDDAQTSPAAPSSDVSAPIDSSKAFATIGEVMAWARQRISELASVPVDAVKLDLTIKS
jgi:hypothetical protein